MTGSEAGVQVEQGTQPESYLVEREECQGEEMTGSQAGVQVEQGFQPVSYLVEREES
jgi:hypothetical protein